MYADISRQAIAINGSFFNTQRMAQQYDRDAYSAPKRAAEFEATEIAS